MRIHSPDGREVIAVDEGLHDGDLSVLGDLTNTQHLNVSFNALTSLRELGHATALRNLNVSGNALASLEGIECLTHLQRLRCSGNLLDDLSCLETLGPCLPSLKELWIHENRVGCSDLPHLASLKSLEILTLHPNPCTQDAEYVLNIVKLMPWIQQIDTIVVDATMREQAQHACERSALNSAATDITEISLLTTRSIAGIENVSDNTEDQNHSFLVDAADIARIPSNSIPLVTETTSHERKTKKPTKMTAEEYMRAFPVQDFIPAAEVSTLDLQPDLSFAPVRLPQPSVQPLPAIDNQVAETKCMDSESRSSIQQVDENVFSGSDKLSPQKMSAFASAVSTLPTFDKIGLGQKKSLSSKTVTQKKRAEIKSGTQETKASDAEVISFHQTEWSVPYSNSTVVAVQIRPDGSALAKWPNGAVAVSVDRERNGFRVYAAHKDGSIALSFDADGVGFINYHPSGRMMISTSSTGDGLYFSPDGCTIKRQWDSSLQMKNERWEQTELLGDEPDGSVLMKLSDGLGIRLRLRLLHNGTVNRPSPIDLQVFFAPGSIRHVFTNWINKAGSNESECEVIFGKDNPKVKHKRGNESPARTHFDTLHDIRAAVANLK